MRLQLILAAALAGELGARTDVYDDGWITVVAPSVHAEVGPVAAEWTLDALSGATPLVDGVTGATRMVEARQEVALSWTEEGWSTGWTTSVEPDYVSHAFSGSLTRELFNRRAKLTAALGLGVDTLVAPREQAVTPSIDLTWAHVLSRRTALTVMATGAWSSCGPKLGCAANPWRYVSVNDGAFALRERHPDTRARAALSVRVAHALTPWLAAHAGWRSYADSWEVVGHAADVAVAVAVRDLVLRGEARAATQGAATFSGAVVAPSSVPAWRTADRELGGVDDLSLGGRVAWTYAPVGPLDAVTPSLRLSRSWYRYPSAPDRAAWVAGGGVDVAF